MAKHRKTGSVPRGFRAGAALGPETTAIARLYAERVALFDRLVEAHGVAEETRSDELADAVFEIDRRLLSMPISRLADLGAKARILRLLAAGLESGGDLAPRLGFEVLTTAFLLEIESALGSPVERAAGLAAN